MVTAQETFLITKIEDELKEIKKDTDLFSGEKIRYETIQKHKSRSRPYYNDPYTDSDIVYQPGEGGKLFYVEFIVPFFEEYKEAINDARKSIIEEKERDCNSKQLETKEGELLMNIFRKKEFNNMRNISLFFSLNYSNETGYAKKPDGISGEKNHKENITLNWIINNSPLSEIFKKAMDGINKQYIDAVKKYIDNQIEIKYEEVDYIKIARRYSDK